MRRRNWFEITDHDRCPRLLRDTATGILRFTSVGTNMYGPVVPLLKSVLERLDYHDIVDLCSGGRVGFVAEPVDATDVPQGLRGFRTMFASFHYFRPGAASNMRTCSPGELRELVEGIEADGYAWETGQVRGTWDIGRVHGRGLHKITCLFGYPESRLPQDP